MDSKLRDLLKEALSRTQAGKLTWQAFDSTSFRARVGSGSIHVQRAVFLNSVEMPQTRYSVQIANAQGQVIAEVEATEGQPDEQLIILQALFTAARTSALGGYQVIDDMLRVLRAG